MFALKNRWSRLLWVGLVVAVMGCDKLPQVAQPSPTPGPTATAAPPPSWEDLTSYRVAMVSSAADEVQQVEVPTFYYIQAHLDMTDETPRIHAMQTTRYSNKTDVPLEFIYFRLLPNKPS